MSVWSWLTGKGKQNEAQDPQTQSTVPKRSIDYPQPPSHTKALPSTESIPPKVTDLLRSPEPARRQDGIDELRKISGPDVRGLLSDILFVDQDKFVRQSALHALAEMYGQDVSEILIKVLRSDPERRVRVSACKFLGEWKIIDALFEALCDSGHTVRETAIEYLGDAGILDPLVRMLGDPEGEVRQVAAETLGRNGNRSIIPALERLSTDEDTYVRSAAKAAIESIEKRTTNCYP